MIHDSADDFQRKIARGRKHRAAFSLREPRARGRASGPARRRVTAVAHPFSKVAQTRQRGFPPVSRKPDFQSTALEGNLYPAYTWLLAAFQRLGFQLSGFILQPCSTFLHSSFCLRPTVVSPR
jgi:hypothetical protein